MSTTLEDQEGWGDMDILDDLDCDLDEWLGEELEPIEDVINRELWWKIVQVAFQHGITARRLIELAIGPERDVGSEGRDDER
jgi:hypothetical protein